MEDEPAEEQIVAKERVNKVLQKFDKVAFNLSFFKKEIGIDTEGSLYLPSQLFVALKSCERYYNYDSFFKIGKFLGENGLCSTAFKWKMFVNFLQKDITKQMPLLPEVTKVMLKWPRIHHDEVCLVNTVILLTREMYEKAKEHASKFTGEKSQKPFKKVSNRKNRFDDSKTAASSLLMGFKTILDFQPDDDEALIVMKESFNQLISMDTCEPLFAETYVCVLMQLKLQQEAEIFLKEYVEKESKGNVGIMPALHALNIMKVHMPKPSLAVTISFLEMIAVRSPGDAKVLELCQHYLHVQNSGMNFQSDTESDLDFGSDNGAISFYDRRESLSKCLQLIVYFLDEHIFNLPSAAIREGWNILADTMRRICVQETNACLQSIVDLWHNDRKRWWPCFRLPRTGLPSTLANGDSEFLSKKGFVCYVLESSHHPYVATLLERSECRLLKSLVKQLSHQKTMLDSKIEPIIKANGPILLIPLKSPTTMPHVTLPGTQTPGAQFNPRFEAVDSELMAKEFMKDLLTRKPLKERKDCKSLAKPTRATNEIQDLKIDEVLSNRFKKRRSQCVQSRFLRMTRSSRSAALSAGGSVCSLESLDSLDSVHTFMDVSENDSDDPEMDDWQSPCDLGGDGISNIPDAGLCNSAKIEAAKIRWEGFINSGEWEALSEDEIDDRAYQQLASDDEYAPSYCSEDSDASSFYDQENQSEIGSQYEERNVSSVYTGSKTSSVSLNSQASFLSNVSTPLLQFPDVPSQSKETIQNVDHYMEIDNLSALSNATTTDEIAESINRVIKNLDVDIGRTYTSPKSHRTQQEAEEHVVEEDIAIPDEALTRGGNQNYRAAIDMEPNSNGCVLEENAGRPEFSFGSNLNRSYSRDFEASSPDMFASSSETGEEINLAVHQQKAFIPRNADIFTPTPIAGSTPKRALKVKTPKVCNAPLEGLNSRKKNQRKSVEKSVCDSLLVRNRERDTTKASRGKSFESTDDVHEEFRASQDDFHPTSKSKHLSASGSKTQGKASHDQSNILHPGVEEMLETVKTVRKKKRLPSNAPNVASTSSPEEKSMSDTNNLVAAKSIEVTFPSVMKPPELQPPKSRVGSVARKCHTRERDPMFLSESDNESLVSASKAKPPKKPRVRSKVTNAVSSAEKITSIYSSENLPSEKTLVTGQKVKVKQLTKAKSKGKKKLDNPVGMNSSDCLSADALIEQILAESKTSNSTKTPGEDKPKTKGTRRKLSTDSGTPKKAKLSEDRVDVPRSVEDILLKYLGDEEPPDNSKDTTGKNRPISKAAINQLGKSSATDKVSSPPIKMAKKSKAKSKKEPANHDIHEFDADPFLKTSATTKKKSTKKISCVTRESNGFDPLSFVEQLLQESLQNSLPATLPTEKKNLKAKKFSS